MAKRKTKEPEIIEFNCIDCLSEFQYQSMSICSLRLKDISLLDGIEEPPPSSICAGIKFCTRFKDKRKKK